MEGFGFLAAAYGNPQVDALVIRGISDLLDRKNENNEALRQKIASHNASAFAFEILANLDYPHIEQNYPIAPPDPVMDPFLHSGVQLSQKITQFATISENGKILFLLGPVGSGKTSSISRLLVHAQELCIENKIIYIDLSFKDIGFIDSNKLYHDYIIIFDHLECLFESHRIGDYYKLKRYILSLVQYKNRILILADQQSSETYRQTFGLAPFREMQLELGSKNVDIDIVLPLSQDQVSDFCRKMGIQEGLFQNPDLCLPGFLALASIALEESKRINNENFTPIDLIYLYLKRSIQLNSEKSRDIALSRVVRSVARHTLGYHKGFVTLSDLVNDLNISVNSNSIKDVISDPLHFNSGRISFASSSVEKIAAASSLVEMLECDEASIPIKRSPEKSILPLMGKMVTLHRVTSQQIIQTLASMRGKDFSHVGYNAMIYSNLLLIMDDKPAFLNLTRLWMQGPEHNEVNPVPIFILQEIKDHWIKMLLETQSEFLNMIETTVLQNGVSSFRGGDLFWSRSREWAFKHPIRTIILSALEDFINQFDAWRYEDVLDVLVVDVTTEFMKNLDNKLRLIVKDSFEEPEEILADLWDGLNDGAWDVLINMQNQWEGLKICNNTLRCVDFSRAHLQRSCFFSSDVTGASFANSYLHLADFRSARGVCSANFSGSDWYNALLRPTDRYLLSKTFKNDEKYQLWCRNPPWNNPYYKGNWPDPFGD